MNRIWKSFFNSMEKKAFWGSALYAGMELLGLKEGIKEMKGKARLRPLQRGRETGFKLRSPYSYQFEGGKYMDSARRMAPRLS